MTQLVHLIEVIDPLNTRNRNVSRHEWRDGLTVADLYPTQIGTASLAISINGGMVEQSQMRNTGVAPGDFVVVAPIPEGGGGGKSILRLVAMIALTVASGGIAGAIGGALGGTFATATSIAMIQAGVVVAGSMLINAILPMPTPKTGGGADTDNSATYGADGAKNTSAEGIPVPVVYGTYRTAGNVLGLYTVNEGIDTKVEYGAESTLKTGQRQWLHMLINLGEGPVSAISDIEVNDQPIESYVWRPEGATVDQPAYEFQTYLGTPTQGPIQWFSKSITPVSVQTKIVPSWTPWSTDGEVDRLRIDLFSSTGIFHLNPDGSYSETSFDIEIQYRAVGSGTWLPMPGYLGNSESTDRVVPRMVQVVRPWSHSSDSGTFEGTDTFTELYVPTGKEKRVGNTYRDASGTIVADIYPTSTVGATGIFKITANQRNGWRTSITSSALAEGEYEVQFRRLVAESTDDETFNTVFVSDINEIRNETVGYRNTALLAVRLLMTDKLSGQPNITCKVDGRVIKTWNSSLGVWQNVHSANPAWIAFDALTHKRYGGGSPESRFDIEMWKEWAEFCDDQSLEFHGVFDTTQTAWDAVQKVLRVGHAQIVPLGTKFTVAIERAADPEMQFSVANMVEGSFKINWLPVTERANEVELTYQDAADGYKQHSIKAVDTSAVAAGQGQRTSQVSMMGVVNAQQAWNEATLMLNMNKYILQTVEFSAPAEAISCVVGDVVLVQHDMPQWGFAGRTAPASTTTLLKLDRKVTMQYGVPYQALVHMNSVVKFSGTVFSAIGNSIVLNGYTGATNVRRLTVGGIETAVMSVFQSGPNWGVIVEDGTGITPGAAYSLHNTDEIVTRSVVNPTTLGSPTIEVTQLTLGSALPTAPGEFVNWMFGEVGKVAKPFRIRSIGGEDAVNRDIIAIEYNASIYSSAGAAPTPNYSSISSVVDQAVIYGVRETKKLIGSTYKSVVTIRFGPASPRSSYSRSEVLASVGDDPWKSLGFSAAEISLEAAVGEIIRFKVIARDTKDRPASGANAPETSYRVTGQTTVPGAVSGIAYTFEDTGIRFSWNPPNALNWNATAVRRGATGTWDTTAVNVYGQRGTSVLVPFLGAATWRYLFRHEMTGVSNNAEAFVDVTVLPPATATPVATTVQSGTLNLQWGNLKTTQPLASHEIRVGATWAGATLYAIVSGTAQAHSLTFAGDAVRRIWVVATDKGGNAGTPSYVDVSVTSTGNGDTSVPPTPTGIAVLSRFGTNYVSWTAASYSEGGGHEESLVFAATWVAGPLPTIIDAVPIGTIANPGNGWADVAGPGTQRHYWIVHRSKAGIMSAPGGGTNGLQVVTVKLGSADMDDAIITTAKFAGGIEPVTIVSSVPLTLSTKAIFNTTDGKLYRWNDVLAEYKTMPASELSTQISAAELAADSVIAGKVAAGAINAREVAAQAIRTDKLLVTGQGAAINSDPNTVDVSAWVGGTFSIVTDTTSPTGSALAITSATTATLSNTVPLAASKNYDIRASAKKVSGAGTCYLGVAFFDATGAVLPGYLYPTGWSSTGAYHYFGLLGTIPPATWTEYRVSFGPDEVAKIPAGAVACAVVVIANYSGAPGEQRFTSLRISEKTDANLIVDGTIGAAKMEVGIMSADNVLTRGLTVRDPAGNIVLRSGTTGLAPTISSPHSFFDSFEYTTVSGWTNHSGSGELSTVASSFTVAGGRILRIGNNSGDDGARLTHNVNIVFDPTSLYRVKVRVRVFNGTGTFYVGVAGVAADGVTFVNRAGANSTGSQHYVAAANEPGSTSFAEYVGYFKGTAASGEGAVAFPDPDNPAVLHEDVKYIRPFILANYNGETGTTDIDYISIERLESGAMSQIDQITSGNATTFIDNAAINSAQIGSLNADVINAGAIRGINVNASSHTTTGSYLTSSASGGATTLNLKSTVDFPASGTARFIDTTNDRDVITYTGKTATTLTGCSGVLAHNSGATIIPNTKAMVIDEATNEMRFFGNRGDGTIAELASLGTLSPLGDYTIGAFGTLNNGGVFYDAVRGQSETGRGVLGQSVDGTGVQGSSTNGPGLSAASINTEACYLVGNGTAAPLALNVLTGRPTTRTEGAFAFINTTGGSTDNRTDTPRLCFGDGTNWRFVHDNSIFSG